MVEKKASLPFQQLLDKKYLITLILMAALSFFFLDRPITHFFSIYGESLAHLSKFVQILFKGKYFIPMLGLFCLASFFINKLKKYNSFLCVYGYFMLLGQIFLSVLKVLIGRARPELFIEQGIYGLFPIKVTKVYISFPSGHTINIMILTALLMLVFPKKQYWILGVGLFLSFTRVMYVQHYFSDWFFSAYLGFILIPLGIVLLEKFKKYSITKWLLDRVHSLKLISK